ncbi:hypothetical protein JKP28_21415 [Vibrio vulnificus]|nr:MULTISPECIES: hypothetical protein [Vibrio]EHT4943475.1 hypothetical protein [Vibrio vulnificus]MCA3962591.1 hypothetical protein [Vibrio vulnificus]MCJ0815235.1 hypothetical protein [Vibrio vulnificus]MCR9705544.1 hypothetical protein [Vibrio vulnificus]MDS1773923.1 hypothetical protein [Vibrio vulnificus]
MYLEKKLYVFEDAMRAVVLGIALVLACQSAFSSEKHQALQGLDKLIKSSDVINDTSSKETTRSSMLSKDFVLYRCVLSELERQGQYSNDNAIVAVMTNKPRIISVTSEIQYWILGLSKAAHSGYSKICSSGQPNEVSLVVSGFLESSQLYERLAILNEHGWREPWQPK